jgi:ketosteroid isomerase-like protein
MKVMDAAMPTQRELDEAGIRQQVDALADCLHAKDAEVLRRLYATDVVSYDIDPPLQHVGLEAKMKNWTNAFAFFDVLAYEIRDLHVVVGGDAAFAHGFGRLSGTLKNGSATDGMWVRATFGFRKIDGTWLIAHDQVSVPLDVATGRGVTDLEPAPGD